MTFRKKIRKIIDLVVYNENEIVDKIVNEIIEAVLEALPKKEDNSENWSEEMISKTRGYNIAIDRIREALSK